MTRSRLILVFRVAVLLALAFVYSAEVFFLLPVALVMPPIFQHCPTCQPCTSCVDSLYPAYVDVEISGVADDSCTDCEALDGTYSVPVVCIFGSCCSSSGNFGSLTSCGITVLITVAFSGGPNDIVVEISLFQGILSQVIDFTLVGTGTQDCSRWSGEVLSFTSQIGDNICDFSGATLTITAA
jgi:hypothetical protein